MRKISVAIVGYGNLGKGVKEALKNSPDMELFAIFSRRELDSQSIGAPCYLLKDIYEFKAKIDILILCGGSATDLPNQTKELAKFFNTVDSFDTHAKVEEYYKAVDESAKSGNNISIISVGWDPGLFSINRLFGEAILPKGTTYTFWGRGLSQGHSDAIRRIGGVLKAAQYTVPNKEAIEEVLSGKEPELTMFDSHKRECYVVIKDGYDKEKIENEIKNMPNYFKGYETSVKFIDEDEFNKNHSGMAHGGLVIRSATDSDGIHQTMKYTLNLQSNPKFTAAVLVAYARAAYHMKSLGMSGAKSVFDVAPAWLSPKKPDELRKSIL